MSSLIEVKNLSVHFETTVALDQISFQIPRGKTVGVVGESGSGKSMTALALMGLVPRPGEIPSGEIFFKSENLLNYSEERMRKVRGRKIAMIFQEPMSSLNPILTVGHQIAESLILHQPQLSSEEIKERVLDLLDQVGIPSPSERVGSYPHELSGGQRQRVMIAIAIACSPELLIADEPTTALDVTIQKQILELLEDLQAKYQMSLLVISHDLGVIGELASDIIVMYKGKIVENQKADQLLRTPQHPYTQGLLACRPSLGDNPQRLPTVEDFLNQTSVSSIEQTVKPQRPNETLLEIKNLKTHFPIRKGFFRRIGGWVKAVDGVSFQVQKGKTLGLVGESGCGKTTLGRSLLRLIEPTGGEIFYQDARIHEMEEEELRTYRRKMQIIFQDPYSSLNPRMTIERTLIEPLVIHKLEESKTAQRDIAGDLLKKVGLLPEHMSRYPHEFSGGQRQRICIARALAVRPEFIVCDESVSALDVSVQAQVLNLLKDLQDEYDLTYIFISHDLAVVKFVADDVAVMNQGHIVEFAKSEDIYQNPQSDLTKKLIEAIPQIKV